MEFETIININDMLQYYIVDIIGCTFTYASKLLNYYLNFIKYNFIRYTKLQSIKPTYSCVNVH